MRQQEQGSAADGWDPVKANGVIARPANRARPSKVLINIMILQSDSFEEKNKISRENYFSQTERVACRCWCPSAWGTGSQRTGLRRSARGRR